MWAEKPDSPQADLLLFELRAAVAREPALAARREYAALLEKRSEVLHAMGRERIFLALPDLHAGITAEALISRVAENDWATVFAES